jgi:hypothetical protein
VSAQAPGKTLDPAPAKTTAPKAKPASENVSKDNPLSTSNLVLKSQQETKTPPSALATAKAAPPAKAATATAAPSPAPAAAPAKKVLAPLEKRILEGPARPASNLVLGSQTTVKVERPAATKASVVKSKPPLIVRAPSDANNNGGGLLVE